MFDLSINYTVKQYLILLFFVTTILSCKHSKDENHSASIEAYATEIEAKIDLQVKKYTDLDIFSGIILVAEKGNPIYHKAFGLANRTKKTPNELSTLFDIGSMNKTFTAIVIKQLVAEGKLNFDDYLIDYVTGFEDTNAKKITINHLLNHQSGFADYHTPDYFELSTEERKLQAIVERAKSTRLNFEPGTEDDYSNLGYVILGAVIEKITSKSYFQNVQERIIEPLNLKHTYIQNLEELDVKKAKGYYYTPLGVLEENSFMMDMPNPDGGFLSTTKDIMTFYRSYYYDDVLISKQAKVNDPLFQYLNQLPEGKATGAAGGFEGFNTALYQVYKDDLTIIVFANMDEPVAEHIALDILALTRNEAPRNPALPAVQNVRIAFETEGIDYIKSNFEALTINFHPEDPKDFILNDLGYAYLYEANKPDSAAELFRLNTEMFPDVANCWDSYGEALVKQNEIEKAIDAYSKALEISPGLESAEKALKELKK